MVIGFLTLDMICIIIQPFIRKVTKIDMKYGVVLLLQKKFSLFATCMGAGYGRGGVAEIIIQPGYRDVLVLFLVY